LHGRRAHALRDQAGDDPAGPSPEHTDDPGSQLDLSTEIDDPAGSSGDDVDDPTASPGPAEAPSADTVAAARRRNAEAARIPASRADALVAMAETMLARGPAARDGGERYQVVVTVAHDTLAGVTNGVGEIDDGPFLISEAARRLACDSTVVVMGLDGGGEPLSVGRAMPTIPRHIRRGVHVGR